MIIGDGIMLGAGGETASIIVTAPTGSTVTCTTPDGIVLTATEVSGTWAFTKLKVYGTYTITATNGTKTATSNVMVDSAVEYTLPLQFGVLYADGRMNIPLSFSVTSTSGQIVDTGTVLDIQYARGQHIGDYDAYAEGVIYTDDIIDLTGYSTVYISGVNIVYSRNIRILSDNSENVTLPTNSGGGSRGTLVQISGQDGYVAANTEFTHSVNISDITSARLYFRSLTDATNGGGDNIHQTISKIWLE